MSNLIPDYNHPLFSLTFGMITSTLMILIVLVTFLIQCKLFQKTESISGYLVTFAILASIFYMFCGISYIMFSLFVIGIYNDTRLGYFYDLLQLGFWHFGQLFCYLYLLNRLYVGFKNTIYSLSNQTFIILSTLLVMYLLFCGMILFTASRHSMNNDYTTLDTIEFYSITIASTKMGTLVLDLVISTLLLILFVKKLWNVSNGLRSMSLVSDMDAWSDDVDNINFGMGNMELQRDSIYNVVTKVTILSVILILVSQSVMISSVISWLIKDYVNLSEFNVWIILAIYQWFKAIHIFTASLCIFMGFEFTNNWYQYCCNKCHNKTKQYCIKKINQTMNDYNTF